MKLKILVEDSLLIITNHSEKRTCTTALYQAGIEEQEIMNRTGHHSVDSVQQYKRPLDDMIKEISSALEPKRKKEASDTIITPVSISMNEDTSSSGTIFTHCTFNFTEFKEVLVFRSFLSLTSLKVI